MGEYIKFPHEDYKNYIDTNKKGQRISILLPEVKIKQFRFEIEILNNFYFGIKSTEAVILSTEEKEALKEEGYKLYNDGFVAWKYPHALRSARLNFRCLNLNTANLTDTDYCTKVVSNLVYIINEEIELLKSIFKSN
ncbi:MAG: hypothetical protein HC905_32010 [Bacteroidales bacterium]|nr:hypothetical protein [Bacteroidales bacterium]